MLHHHQQQQQHPQQPRRHLYKVLVLGEVGVGKTSLITRYAEGTFSPAYKATIGVDFATKLVRWDANNDVTLQLWDVAGHERFGHMTRNYYRYAIAAVVVFDLSRQTTFDAVRKWVDDVHAKVMLEDESRIPVLLLANKADLMEYQLSDDTIDSLSRDIGALTWYKVSAKENSGIEEAFLTLIGRIMRLTPTAAGHGGARSDPGLVRLGGLSGGGGGGGGRYCCFS